MRVINQKDWLQMIEDQLNNIEYPAAPASLYRPISYTLSGGGKRLRPMLTLAACEACGAPADAAVNQAIAMEMFHNFTLIHDDVMDRSSKRRGRPTVFHRWGDVQAILSGDTLLSMAYQKLVSNCPADRLKLVLDLFNRTAIEVYEGQQFDTYFESRSNVSIKQYMRTIRLKTGVLLAASCAMGAIMANADAELVDRFYDYGLNLGLAFQLRDDWLDVYGSAAELGKDIGSDIVNRKKTWLFITASNEAGDALRQAYETASTRGALVSRVRRVYNSLLLSDRCNALIEKHHSAAIASVAVADVPDNYKIWFTGLASTLALRHK